MRLLWTFLFLTLHVICGAQSLKEDEIKFQNAVDWLNSKLDYVYFDEQNQRWWTNTFYINENKVVTIKQISSKTRVTANIKSKNYTIRSFDIRDINPYSLFLKEIEVTSGRLVRGSVLEMRTADGSPKIHKTINNRKATSTAYLHLSFPAAPDSLPNKSELVKKKFYEAIIASTRVYASTLEDVKTILTEMLSGKFVSSDERVWKVYEKYEGVFVLETDKEHYTLGHDSTKGVFYLTKQSAEEISIQYFKLRQGNEAALEEQSGTGLIFIDTKNSFVLDEIHFARQ